MQNTLWKTLLISAFLLLLPGITLARGGRQSRILMIHGQAGQANVVEVGGRAYVDVEGLTQIIQGSLSFNANRIVLSLPTSLASPVASEPATVTTPPPVNDSELSREFMRAGIEEFAAMREWASTLANSIQNGYPVTDNWATSYREQAANDLRLASAAASTKADKNALQLLRNEFEAMRDWCNKLLQERKLMDTAKYAISPSALRDDPTSQKILTCGRFLAQMLGSGSFQDDPSCH